MFNGDLKSLLLLWENLACNRRYSRFTEKEDILTFQRRVKNEGLAFLTIVLPELGKALDTFHATNTWNAPPSFKTDDDGIPIFLGKAIRFAIDGNSVAVDCVRQLSYIFYKLEVPYDDDAKAKFLDQFINTDQDLGNIDYDSGDPLPIQDNLGRVHGSIYPGDIVNEMRGLIGRVLSNEDPRDIRPCHGSGATACRTLNHDKWHLLRYYPKLDQVYDYSSYFFFSATHVVDEMEKLESSIEKEPVARVCLVPKDSRGPRVISCEPAELMYIQQGLMRKLYGIIEAHPLTRGLINFTDQGINRDLALLGSITRRYATLDLKDASDRVSHELIRRVFPSDWFECLDACRSEETILPNGVRVKLNKFAPMGSSCCFPVEALVFWACAVATTQLCKERAANFLDRGRLWNFRGKSRYDRGWSTPNIFVYGDDIICDVGNANDIMVGLEAIGLLVNRNKSYVEGPFRESCGGDYHNGYDVTPVRVRNFLSNVGTGLEASADLANEFISKFGYEDSHTLIRVIEDAVGYFYPRTDMAIPMTIRVTPSASNDVFFKRRWNSNLQRFEHRVLQLRYKVLPKRDPNWAELLRKELSREKATARFVYENQLAIVDSRCEPGQYAVAHSARKQWEWAWLG
jgi:hypothetical protein